MSGDGYTYTCSRATKSLVELVRLLGSENLLQSPPDNGFIHQWVQSCAACRKERGANKCVGWRTVVEPGFLVLGPISAKGRPAIRVEISAACGFERSSPSRQSAWDAQPMSDSTVAVEIFQVENDALLERHHVDLANVNQLGPTWHFQYGGNPPGETAKLETSWLQEPRWPTAPLDLTLLTELVVYNFFPEQWTKLNGRGEWIRLMQDAEQLVVSHFAEYMSEHFSRALKLRDRTWLTAQDNSDFDPRPA